MGGAILWLVPAVLTLALLVPLIELVKSARRKSLVVIEPMGTLIKDWHIARFEPNTEAVKKLLKALAGVNLSSGSLLESVIANSASQIRLKSKATKLTLLRYEAIGPLAEQFVVEIGSATQSIIVGPLSQLTDRVDDEKVDQFHHLSLLAAEHGLLALTIATASVHNGSKSLVKHRLEGLILLEPILDRTVLPADEPVRFLTVAPLQFALQLYQELFSAGSHFGLNAGELTTLAPRYAEADLEKAVVIGSADLQARHRVLQSWHGHFACQYQTTNPEDQDLPVK